MLDRLKDGTPNDTTGKAGYAGENPEELQWLEFVRDG